MTYLLDTNVLSEFRKAPSDRIDARVKAWTVNVPQSSLFVSVVSILEIETGILRIERHDRSQGSLLRTWLDDYLLPTFAGRVLAFDLAAAKQCAAFQVPDPRSDRDAMIAATAQIHKMTVVTRNVADFEPTGVAVFNPWDY
jgi:toxin FitB